MNNYSIFRGRTGSGHNYTVEIYRYAIIHRYTVVLHTTQNPQGLVAYSHDWQEALNNLIDLDAKLTPTDQQWQTLKHSQPTAE